MFCSIISFIALLPFASPDSKDSLRLTTISDNPADDLYISYQIGKESYKKEGLYTMTFKNHLQMTGNFRNGQREGTWKFFNINDTLCYQGNYARGKKDGEWIHYHPNGTISSKEYFDHGSREKTSYGYYKNGNLAVMKSYSRDTLDGVVTNYYENGKVSTTETYIKGKFTGPAKKYYESGVLKEEKFMKDAKRDSTYLFYYEDGKLWEHIIYRNGGIWNVNAYNDSTGKPVTKITLKDGTGIMRFYDKEGRITDEVEYKNLSKDGHAKYFEKGKITAEGNYHKNLKDGTWKYFYANGSISLKTTYKDGEKEGIEEDFFDNGKIAYRNTYKHGKKESTCRSWNREGKLKSEINFSAGITEGFVKYYLNGKVTSSGNFFNGQKKGIWQFYDASGECVSKIDFEESPGPALAEENQTNKSAKESEIVYTSSDKMPEFPGGEKNLYEFIAKNIRYSEKAKARGIQGVVVVSFVVTATGEISDPKLIRGVEKTLDTESLRVIRSMPLWNAGLMDGQPVNVRHSHIFTFEL